MGCSGLIYMTCTGSGNKSSARSDLCEAHRYTFTLLLQTYSEQISEFHDLFDHPLSMSAGSFIQTFDSDMNISTTTGWITIKLWGVIHGPQQIPPSDCGEPLTFPLVPPAGLHLWFWVTFLNNSLLWNKVQISMFLTGWTVQTYSLCNRE